MKTNRLCPLESAVAVPEPVEDEPTVPVDVAEMEAVALASKLVPDAATRRMASLGAPRLPYAEIWWPGAPGTYVLAAHNPSVTGVALELPPGLGGLLAEGQCVSVQLRLRTRSGAPLELELQAEVAHCRRATDKRPAGALLRWAFDDPAEEIALTSALSLRPPTSEP